MFKGGLVRNINGMVLTALRVTFGVRITDCVTCVFVCIEEPVFVFECPPYVMLR